MIENKKIVNEIEEYINNIEVEEAIYKSNKIRKTIKILVPAHGLNRGPMITTALPTELCRHTDFYIINLNDTSIEYFNLKFDT